MTRHVVTAAVLSLVITAAAMEPAAGSPALKCRSTGTAASRETVWVVDLVVVDSTAIRTIDGDSIVHVAVLCTDALPERYGIEMSGPRRNAVVVFTAPGARAMLRTALDSIASLQRAHLAAHGAFARTLGDLGWSDRTNFLTIELTLSEDGGTWSATGRHGALGKSADALTVAGERSGTR